MLTIALVIFFGQTLEIALPKKDKEPRAIAYSTRSLEEITTCTVVKLSETRGYEIVKLDAERGYLIQMKFRVAGISATAASIYIQNLGDRRRVVIYATGKQSGAPRQISGQTLSCSSDKTTADASA